MKEFILTILVVLSLGTPALAETCDEPSVRLYDAEFAQGRSKACSRSHPSSVDCDAPMYNNINDERYIEFKLVNGRIEMTTYVDGVRGRTERRSFDQVQEANREIMRNARWEMFEDSVFNVGSAGLTASGSLGIARFLISRAAVRTANRQVIHAFDEAAEMRRLAATVGGSNPASLPVYSAATDLSLQAARPAMVARTRAIEASVQGQRHLAVAGSAVLTGSSLINEPISEAGLERRAAYGVPEDLANTINGDHIHDAISSFHSLNRVLRSLESGACDASVYSGRPIFEEEQRRAHVPASTVSGYVISQTFLASGDIVENPDRLDTMWMDVVPDTYQAITGTGNWQDQ